MAQTTAEARLRTALELFEVGELMMAQRLRAKHPGATSEEIEQRLQAWLRQRPGAELGDSAGTPSHRFS